VGLHYLAYGVRRSIIPALIVRDLETVTDAPIYGSWS
jgi:hypothetical protein